MADKPEERARIEIDQLLALVAKDARPGDHVVIMSNGGFGGLHAKLLERLGERA